MNNKKLRNKKTFTIRLQASEGTPLAEIIDYFNERGRVQALSDVDRAVIMCFLPLARQHHNYGQEKIRLTCLEACHALSSYASYLRQALMVFPTQFEVVQGNGTNHQEPILDLSGVENLTEPASENHHPLIVEEEKNSQSSKHTTQIESKATAEQVNRLFENF